MYLVYLVKGFLWEIIKTHEGRVFWHLGMEALLSTLDRPHMYLVCLKLRIQKFLL